MMKSNNTISEEIVIVGSRYGELADETSLLYKQEGPIGVKDIRKALGDETVYLMPISNIHDDHAVGVYSKTEKFLGHVWMYQAPAMRYWLEMNHQRYVAARITEVIPVAKVLLAVIDQPIDLPFVERTTWDIDDHWAKRLPEELKSISEQSLDLGLQLLHDELLVATEWCELLKLRIDNLLRAIPLDLSAYRYKEYMEVYNLMKQSNIKEVREQSGYLLNTMVYRGSNDHMKWWVEEWLPSYFSEAAEGDLLGMFEADHYTLDRVDLLLDAAPVHLFHLYKVNPFRFAKKLYYSALPQAIYNRLLTLLAVRDAMMKKLHKEDQTSTIPEQKNDEVLFRFIHPSMNSEQGRQIHEEVKRLVAHHAMQEICNYLYQLKEEKKILLPMILTTTYDELVRMGMPQGDGYSMKNFQKYYKR